MVVFRRCYRPEWFGELLLPVHLQAYCTAFAAIVAAAAAAALQSSPQRRAGYRAQRISVLVVRIPLLFFPQSALSLLSVTSSSFFAAMLTKSHLWSFNSSVFPRKPEKFVSISQLIRRHHNLLSRFTDL